MINLKSALATTLPNNTNDRFDRLVDSSNRLVDSFEESSEWNPVMHVLDKFNTYTELEYYVESLLKKLLKPLKCAVSKFKH